MPRHSANRKIVVQQYGNSAETSQHFGVGVEKLKYMRLLNAGPEFYTVGHRTVLYDWRKFELWLSSLPKGGGIAK